MSHQRLIVFALVGRFRAWRSRRSPRIPRRSMGRTGRFQNGVKHQPTRGEVGGEFSRSQQEETDRLYNELMSNSFSATHHTGIARMR